MKKPFIGVSSHEVHWENNIPVMVVLTLRGGIEVVVDLIKKVAQTPSDVIFPQKKLDWCLHIGSYLARQALLQRTQDQQRNLPEGSSTLEFDVRPDPHRVWWG